MKSIIESKRFLYFLTACVIISLLLNVSLIYTLYTTKEKISSGGEELSHELEDLKYEKISFTIPIDTIVTIPVKENIDVDIPFYGKLTIPFEKNLNIPIKTEIKIDKTLNEMGFGNLIDELIEMIKKYSNGI